MYKVHNYVKPYFLRKAGGFRHLICVASSWCVTVVATSSALQTGNELQADETQNMNTIVSK